jgi:GTPase involved in cell partitioning and DNA repair
MFADQIKVFAQAEKGRRGRVSFRRGVVLSGANDLTKG